MGTKLLTITVSLLLLVGCTHTYHPGTAPEVSLAYVGSFESTYSVELIHDQDDSTLRLFSATRGGKHYADYKEWTTFFIEAYARELTKRGVKVGVGSPHRMAVKLKDFSYRHGFARVRVYMTLVLSDPDGTWEKEIKATAVSGWSTGRAFGSIVHNTIVDLLNDREVMERLKI